EGVARAVSSLAGLDKGSKVLDVCCGPGRISVELALLGMDVTGVDITQPFLDAAVETANDEGVEIKVINQDMRKFRSPELFDCAVNLYNSFGYCDSVEDDRAILQSVFNSLKDGGTFIIECISRESAALHFTEGEWFERAGKTVLTDFGVVGAWEGLRSRWILIDEKGGRIEHEFVQRLYSALELKDILLKIGFSDIQIYGGYDLRPYDQNAETMVIVAHKKK
ncbi:MAG: class I SAM-dependent methyltransferase, partial [Treponema sp.]|nr:class I SAM-dependent methyltransferase [Treponema sp.]